MSGQTVGSNSADFSRAMPGVARELLGKPNEQLSSDTTLRFGTNGSLSVELPRGVWRDHETGEGGGVLDLLRVKGGIVAGAAMAWLTERGHLDKAKKPPPAKRPPVATYPYQDAAGDLLFEVVRFEPKDFRQRRPDGRGGWIWNLGDVPKVPYRLPKLLASSRDELVFIVEGEKDADRLAGLGLIATCNAGGACKPGQQSKLPSSFGSHFVGRDVVVVPDNDAAGAEHARAVVGSLRGIAAGLRVLELPNLPAKGDVSDWLDAGGDADQLARLLRDLPDMVEAPCPTEPSPASTPGLPLLWFDDIAPVLEAADFVQGTLIEGGAAVVYGDSNVGKTFWVTDLALHVAAGMRWNDRRVDRGGVIYVALEGGNGFRNRVSAWREVHGGTGPLPFAAVTSPINLLDPDADAQSLIDAITAARTRMGCPVKLVVVDTLSRALAGGNENDSADMGALVGSMDRIRAETGACVLFTHHSGKDAAKGARGHSLLRAAIDTEIEVRVEPDTGLRTAAVVKQRDLAKGGTFTFRLDVKTLGENQHGEPVTTCLVMPETAVASPKGPRLNLEEQGWLSDLVDLFASDCEAIKTVPPEPGAGVQRCAPRDLVRSWLMRKNRLGVASDVAVGGALSATERSKFNRYLNKLKDKGKLAMLGDLVWLI